MSQARRNHNGNGQGGQNRRPVRTNLPKPTDLWRPVPQLPEVEPVVVSNDPGALLRSLGDPPLMSKSTVAGHYMATVVERAAGLASALAASADLLRIPDQADD
jgi:hypothetical protein